MLKITFRKNHIYLVFLFFSYFVRRIISIILSKIFGFSTSILFCFLMCLGQIIGGSVVYCYQDSFLKKKTKKTSKSFLYHQLVVRERKLKKADSCFIIIILIFFASFFDLEEYFITSVFIPKISKLSSTSSLRLCCIMTITSSLICITAMKYKIGRHQILSLIILSIISFIIIILEFIYKPKDVPIGKYIISYLLLFFHFFFRSFTDVTEKYLGDYDFMNPFLIIMTEGIISFIETTIYSLFNDPFKEFSNVHKQTSTGQFVGFIFVLFTYLILCAFVNVYKILCNILYSPMTKSLSSYFLNSALIIYHYVYGNDFVVDEEKNLFFFLINLFFSILIDFFGLMYNEFFVLNFCGLSVETHDGISLRAKTLGREMSLSIDLDSDFDINDIESEK